MSRDQNQKEPDHGDFSPANKPTSNDPNPPINKFLAQVFIDDEGEFRSGWRVFAFAACLIIIALLVNAFLQAILGLVAPSLSSTIYGSPAQDSQDAAQLSPNAQLLRSGAGSLIDFICAATATAICARVLEHRSLSSVGYKFHSGWVRDFSVGLIAGTVMISAAAGLEVSTGSLSLAAQSHTAAQDVFRFVALFAVFAFAAALEELIFRGFPFQALVHNIGPPAALAITSVGFGLVHLQNPSATAISTVNTMVAGIWLGVAYLKTRSLWLCTGLHLSWNLVMVFVFGLPVSGITDFVGLGLFLGNDKAPVWLSGGAYGPEGGLACSAILIISSVILWKTRSIKPAPQMLEATQHGRPEPRYISLSLDRSITKP